jgi:hypothetical protein
MTSTLPIQTQHCAFCNHLLLATTRTLSTLPRRAGEGKDAATILPLENNHRDLEAELEDEAPKTRHVTQHTTLLLATTIPDRRATLIRREDGIEKRLLLRCGRCRVVVGYYLDRVHWGNGNGMKKDDEGESDAERPPAVYILPGALVETEKMGSAGDEGWREWIKE